jgi:hypothetical protein
MSSRKSVDMGFEKEILRLEISSIQPLRLVNVSAKRTTKYTQILASIKEVGIIEPPVVARQKNSDSYLLLDGHLRLEVLKDIGATEVDCLISTDDEAFTYNRHISRLATIQEYRMIKKAMDRGVSEDRIARALDIEVNTLRSKTQLLIGICPEAVELLKDKHVSVHSFAVLKRMNAIRQIEAAELMIAMNNYTTGYAKSLLIATPQSQLVEREKRKKVKGLTDEQIALMERESANLDREFKIVEESYGNDHLDLVLAAGFLRKLLSNARIIRYLTQWHEEILAEFRKLADTEQATV